MAYRTVTFRGTPIRVSGPELSVGESAPDFVLQKLTADGPADVSLKDYAGKTLILSVVPSVDTSVCATQTKTWNARLKELGDSVAVLTVSVDLPFALGRFCNAEDLHHVETASDHRDVSFGAAYGVLIDEGPLKRILARALFVVGKGGKLKHVQYVPEIATEPDYDAAAAALAA